MKKRTVSCVRKITLAATFVNVNTFVGSIGEDSFDGVDGVRGDEVGVTLLRGTIAREY